MKKQLINQLKPFEESLNWAENVPPLTMIYIPSGEFLIGSPNSDDQAYDHEKPQHLVKMPEFYIAETPITQAQWRAIASTKKILRDLKLNPSYFKGDDLPVEQVRWQNAMEFCARLSRETGRNYRLPTEAEWEYACRAGSTTRYYFGDSEQELEKYAWYSGNSGGKTHPVGQKIPNQWELYDMHGNVWEWCLDNWHHNYENAPTDGSVWSEQANKRIYLNLSKRKNLKSLLSDFNSHITRGGSWDNSSRYCRSACRNLNNGLNDNHGVRVVCEIAKAFQFFTF